jgi:2-dehydro-3-deoxyphosphogluconate aldolase / (4S)-4-hydroxy-2-oxoglutarate aldolase
MAIFRGLGVERSLELAQRAWDLGINSVELPLQNEEDAESIRHVAALGKERGKSVGAGTILHVEEIELAEQVGASYLVSPGIDTTVVLAAYEAGIPFLPGVATPSELQTAQRLGLTWVKAFPASWLTPQWFSLMRGPFPGMKFVATGGLHGSNAQSFLDAGVEVVALGSALEDPAQLETLSALASSNR